MNFNALMGSISIFTSALLPNWPSNYVYESNNQFVMDYTILDTDNLCFTITDGNYIVEDWNSSEILDTSDVGFPFSFKLLDYLSDDFNTIEGSFIINFSDKVNGSIDFSIYDGEMQIYNVLFEDVTLDDYEFSYFFNFVENLDYDYDFSNMYLSFQFYDFSLNSSSSVTSTLSIKYGEGPYLYFDNDDVSYDNQLYFLYLDSDVYNIANNYYNLGLENGVETPSGFYNIIYDFIENELLGTSDETYGLATILTQASVILIFIALIMLLVWIFKYCASLL